VVIGLQKQDGDQANETQRDAGNGKPDSGALVVTAAARAALGSAASSAGLLELALADVLALLELALGLERVVEIAADGANVTSGLEVENTLDKVQRRRLDPGRG
jgi:hypothetical protein